MPDFKSNVRRTGTGMSTTGKINSSLKVKKKGTGNETGLTGYSADSSHSEIHQTNGPKEPQRTCEALEPASGHQLRPTVDHARVPAVLTKGSPPLDSSNTTPVTNGQIHNNNNINKTNKKLNGSTKVPLNSDGNFDRKRHLIGEEFFKQETKDEISAENLTRIQTIVPATDENGTPLIYETTTNSTEDNSVTPSTVGQTLVFENSLTVQTNSAGEPAKIATEPSHDINLPNDEDLLKRLENADNPDAIVTDAPVTLLCSNDGSVSSPVIIDTSKLSSLYGPGTGTVATDFQPNNAYMASLLSQNEPEDLTGNRRVSNNHDEGNDAIQLATLKLTSDKHVVTTTEGQVVLSAADLSNVTFQTAVPTSDGTHGFAPTPDFGNFERPISYSGPDPYRPNDIYCVPGGEYPAQRSINSDGVMTSYYKIEPGTTPVPNANNINSPDSGIGDPTLNASHPQEPFDTYPHADILNEIGNRKPWHQDYGRPNEEKIVIPKAPPTPYGFKYTLEAPTSSSVRKEDDRITYVNKGQFYGITLEYVMDPQEPAQPFATRTVRSVIMVLFRDGKSPDDEQKFWQYWHSRQHSTKQRILDADTKNSVGICGQIEELSHNALAVYWNPLESPAKVNLAVQCLSTDFSSQKGVKGMPLHVQIDTYDDIRDGSPVFHRGYAQIKVFCDKGAERKARDEERRANKRKMNNSSGKRRLDEMYHPALERSEFYAMQDTHKPPVLFTPPPNQDKAAIDFGGTDVPSYYSRGSPPEHPMLKINGSNGSPSPSNTPLLPGGQPSGGEPLPKKARIYPPTSERIMIYVKQETEANFTALHVMPPDFGGLVKAIENKYKINGRCIRDLFKQSLRGHKVKMDDDMIAHYSNEAAFLMQVHVTEFNEQQHQQVPGEENSVYDITLTEI